MVVLYTALIVSKPLVYPYANGNFRHSRVVGIYVQRGASFCCSFPLAKAISYEPQSVEQAIVKGFTLSLCPYRSNQLQLPTVAVALDRERKNDYGK